MENLLSDTVSVRCLLCGSASDSLLTFFRGFRIAKCSDCNFIFVNPRPTEKSLLRFYANREKNPFFFADYEPLEFELPTLAKILRKIQSYVRTGELLEVGCGRGDFLMMAQTKGFSVTGCDIFGGQKPTLEGVSFYDSSLTEARFSDNSFDVVIIRNVFEHLFDPSVELREIRRILKPNGYLYLKVPNGVFEYGLRCRLVHNKKYAFEPPYHLNSFSPTSLKKFLETAQFEFVSWYLEQPTLRSKRTVNFFRQASYRATQVISFFSGGRIFPKLLLSCIARKKP
jgi:2-polyprenyl-3-methyl-5-hydroxy-6-metoxy-1,4-benzoquinol methylase